MTSIVFDNTSSVFMNTVKINGRKIIVGRITSVNKVGPGRWEGTANGKRFEIEGGKAAGGSSTDWFVEWDDVFNGALVCKSAKECVELIETA